MHAKSGGFCRRRNSQSSGAALNKQNEHVSSINIETSATEVVETLEGPRGIIRRCERAGHGSAKRSWGLGPTSDRRSLIALCRRRRRVSEFALATEHLVKSYGTIEA